MTNETLSFKERLAALQTQGGKTARDILTEAQERRLYAADFFSAMAEGDTLGIAYQRETFGRPLPTAIKEWNEKPWEAQLAFLASIAPHNEVARRVLGTLELFQENDLLQQTLRAVISEIGRPSRRVFSETQFSMLLGDLEIKGLAISSESRPNRRAFNFGERWWMPTSVNKSRLAWPFVVKALGRVRAFTQVQKEVMPLIQPLLDRATLESSLEDQGFQKLLTFSERIGSLVIWDGNSRGKEGNDLGLLGLLVGREVAGSTSLILQGWVAARPLTLPQDQDYELPCIYARELPGKTLEIGFEKFERVSQEEFNSLNRIMRLMRRRLSEEGRFQVPALTAKSSD